ncbi:MAG: DUF6441 family protein, partial [Alphaproteobacteria bacterium]
MIGIGIEGDLRRLMETRLQVIGQAVNATVVKAAEVMKDDLRRQTEAAGLGKRLAESWNVQIYRNNGINAAAMVYTTAPAIMGSH